VSGAVFLRNRQRNRRIEIGYLREVTVTLLERMLKRSEYELGIHLVARPQMTRLNETYLHHQGSTDVITFNYADPARPDWLAGDIFVCVVEAVEQGALFGTTWQSEVVRYLVHGVLHLCGFDDHAARDKLRMKREEDRLVAGLSREFRLNHIEKEFKGRRPASGSRRSRQRGP
jgi:probable rRNA maturation factor